MISLLEVLNEAKEVKIYLEPGQKPPKGKKLLKGPKGGHYFMGTPEEKKKTEKKPKTKKKVNIFDKPKTKVVKKQPTLDIDNVFLSRNSFKKHAKQFFKNNKQYNGIEYELSNLYDEFSDGTINNVKQLKDTLKYVLKDVEYETENKYSEISPNDKKDIISSTKKFFNELISAQIQKDKYVSENPLKYIKSNKYFSKAYGKLLNKSIPEEELSVKIFNNRSSLENSGWYKNLDGVPITDKIQKAKMIKDAHLQNQKIWKKLRYDEKTEWEDIRDKWQASGQWGYDKREKRDMYKFINDMANKYKPVVNTKKPIYRGLEIPEKHIDKFIKNFRKGKTLSLLPCGFSAKSDIAGSFGSLSELDGLYKGDNEVTVAIILHPNKNKINALHIHNNDYSIKSFNDEQEIILPSTTTTKVLKVKKNLFVENSNDGGAASPYCVYEIHLQALNTKTKAKYQQKLEAVDKQSEEERIAKILLSKYMSGSIKKFSKKSEKLLNKYVKGPVKNTDQKEEK